MRLIDADQVINKLYNDERQAFTKHEVWLMLSAYANPTIEAEPIQHGHWFDEEVEEAGGIYTYTRCSVCGEYILYDAIGQEIETLYCPWCGAKMDEEIEDEIN